MIRIAIASESHEKIAGITEAFEEAFAQLVSVSVKKTNSGVPAQPFGKEIYIGALNRIKNLQKSMKKESYNYNYFVSCEAGIECYSSLYFNVQVVCIYDVKKQKCFFGKSSGWQIPTEDIKRIKKIGVNQYLLKKGFTSIEQFLGLGNSRLDAVKTATHYAISVMNL